tara:strand:+ start:4968 stop:5354 length:387 start_codon:yes stop_codon:yes gene_type:complete
MNYLNNKLEKWDLFDDKCLFDIKGVKQKGPGILCTIYLFLIILGTLFTTVSYIKYINSKSTQEDKSSNSTQEDKSSNFISYVSLISYIFYSILQFLFMYKMCSICRGLQGFFIIIIINCFISILIRIY